MPIKLNQTKLGDKVQKGCGAIGSTIIHYLIDKYKNDPEKERQALNDWQDIEDVIYKAINLQKYEAKMPTA